MKIYRDKMKTDTDKYEQIKKEWNKKNVKIKETKEWHTCSNAGGNKEKKKRTTKKIQSKTKSKKKTNKQSHLVHPIKEMNVKKSKQFKKNMR